MLQNLSFLALAAVTLVPSSCEVEPVAKTGSSRSRCFARFEDWAPGQIIPGPKDHINIRILRILFSGLALVLGLRIRR